MPAAEIARIRPAVQDLGFKLTQPKEFVNAVDKLLEIYGDQVHLEGEEVEIATHLPIHHIPDLVKNELTIAFGNFSKTNPVASLAAANELWQSNSYESKILAAHLASTVPVPYFSRFEDLITSWCKPTEDRLLLQDMVYRTGEHLRKDQVEFWIALMKKWIKDDRLYIRSLGSFGLAGLVSGTGFEALPMILDTIQPILLKPNPGIQSGLLQLLENATKVSPSETSVFLLSILQRTKNPDMQRLVRKLLPSFSLEYQQTLREKLVKRQD